jgi:erythromycin esterase
MDRRRLHRAAVVAVSAFSAGCVLVIAACSNDAPATGPDRPNPSFVAGVPDGWSSNASGAFAVGLSQSEKHGGTASLYVTGTDPSPKTFVSVAQSLRADDYRGKRLRWSAWVKQQGLAGDDVGLYMRVDGPGIDLGFDNMATRPLTGSADWHQVSVVLDVPANALGIGLGVLSDASGTLLVDDMALDVVGSDVATTSIESGQSLGADSATVAATYSRASSALSNLDFEGLPGPSSDVVAWISRTATPLATTDPTADLDDLAPLEQVVGPAHVVGMGEDTHGTREFFQMKHRILEYLVTRMGFTYFAIEATAPESDDMNRYVLTGEGDPKALLSRLYFWTWDTQEVLDMIEWMRQWNATAPANRRVQFLGFDMQFPGAAMDSVAAFVGRVDPGNSDSVNTAYSCIVPYRNVGGTFRMNSSQYAGLTTATKTACAAALQSIYDLMQRSAAMYTAATSPAAYQQALHSARLVQQFEAMASVSSPSGSSQMRDRAMAENVTRIRDQAGPDAKIALWAHNGHINAVPSLMGGYLRASYGADYLPLGFAFGTGGFNAVGPGTSLKAWRASIIPKSSIEAAFTATNQGMFMLDMRKVAAGGSAAAPLRGPIAMRSIGAVFDENAERAYFANRIFPNDFDVLIYLRETSPSTLLPFS